LLKKRLKRSHGRYKLRQNFVAAGFGTSTLQGPVVDVLQQQYMSPNAPVPSTHSSFSSCPPAPQTLAAATARMDRFVDRTLALANVAALMPYLTNPQNNPSSSASSSTTALPSETSASSAAAGASPAAAVKEGVEGLEGTQPAEGSSSAAGAGAGASSSGASSSSLRVSSMVSLTGQGRAAYFTTTSTPWCNKSYHSYCKFSWLWSAFFQGCISSTNVQGRGALGLP
jgi:hypothetical protein